MRNVSRDINHPMQPLSPKRQPWAMTQAPFRKKALASGTKYAKEATATLQRQTVQQELLLRERIEERAMQKLEKLHDAVSLDRQARRLQRQKSAGHPGEIVKALQEHEKFKRSSSLGSTSSH